MSKLDYLGLSILDLSNTVRYEFWYDFVKPKYGEKSKLCYIDTGPFNVHVRTKDIYREIAENVEKRSDISNFEIERKLLIGKNKVIGLMKNELGGQIMKKFVGLKPNSYSYLKDNDDEGKKSKGTKKCFIKRKLKFQDYKNCLKRSQCGNRINYFEKKEIDADCHKQDKKEFIENRLTLKTKI